jgi:hypothetical protein
MTCSFRSAAWLISYIVRQNAVVYTYNECCRQYGDKDLVADVGEAKVNEHLELLRRVVELSVVGREYFEVFESYEPIRSDSV